MKNRIYLDNASSTPLDPQVRNRMLACFTDFYGNASSVHSTGREARRLLEESRRQCAQALGVEPRELYFTSGGTESDNWALLGVALANQARGRHIITTSVEHHAVLHACDALERLGFEVTRLPVDQAGLVSPEDVRQALRPDTILVSVMLANNEIGTVQPVADIARIAHEQGVPVHTDAVQALGALPVRPSELGVDLLSLSAHKFHGPQGMGALYLRQGVHIDSFHRGGSQERGLRAGTENLAGAAGMALAMEKAVQAQPENAARISGLRDLLTREILRRVPDAVLNGDPLRRLPGNVHFSFPGAEGEALLLRLDLMGIAVSGGSACTSGSTEPSHVLAAIGQEESLARSGIRFSIGTQNTREEILETAEAVGAVVRDLRSH